MSKQHLQGDNMALTIQIKRATIKGVKTYIMLNPFTNTLIHAHSWAAVETLAKRLKVNSFTWADSESETNRTQVLN